MLLIAAAGNCIPGVWFPANHDKCLALAGIGPTGTKAQCSSYGREVDVSGPAEAVWRAFRYPEPDYPNQGVDGAGEGTSYATALTAGVAALWLAHCTPAALAARATANHESLQEFFTRKIRETARPIGNWDYNNFGTGVVNAEALLKETDAELAAAPPRTPKPGKESGRVDTYAEVLRRDLTNAVQLAGFRDVGDLALTAGELEECALELTSLLHRVRVARIARHDLYERAKLTRTAPPYISKRLASILTRASNAKLSAMLEGLLESQV
jgi:hypothetical protein